MKFKDAFLHYKEGTATNDEREFVEEELEKAQLIEEYQTEHWIDPIPTEELTPDIQVVRKKLQKNKLVTVLLPVIIVAALATAAYFSA